MGNESSLQGGTYQGSMDVDTNHDEDNHKIFVQKQIYQELNIEKICDRQIFLETIDDIFKTIDGHEKFLEKEMKKKSNIIFNKYDEKYIKNELLNRIDSLINLLKIFSLSCCEIAKQNDSDTLKLGILTIEKNDKYYNTIIGQTLLYALNGNKLNFPKRMGSHTNNIFSFLISGQHKIYDKQDIYKDKNCAKKLNEKHQQLLNENVNEKSKHDTMPDISQIYKKFQINDVQFSNFKQKDECKKPIIDDDIDQYPKNACVVVPMSNTYPQKIWYICCEILERSNGGRVLVKYACNQKLRRPLIKNVIFCDNKKGREQVARHEIYHSKKHGHLPYESVAPKNQIDQAMDIYFKNLSQQINSE